MTNAGSVHFIVDALCSLPMSSGDLRIIEVGSFDVYGGYRSVAELHGGFSEYVGVDIKKGPGVDVICGAEDIVARFGLESFDVVIATELLEHVRDWRRVVSNLKRVCRTGGSIIITTRSRGYRYHGVPFDYWRFEAADMREIFSDCEIHSIREDDQSPGVFASLSKPVRFVEKDLSDLRIYSIIAGCRVKDTYDVESHGARVVRVVLKAKVLDFLSWLSSDSRDRLSTVLARQFEEVDKLRGLFSRKK